MGKSWFGLNYDTFWKALEGAHLIRPELQQLELLIDAREQGIIIKPANRFPDVDSLGEWNSKHWLGELSYQEPRFNGLKAI